jgi:uncharacterized membrane protein
MSDVPLQLIVAAFDDEDSAEKALRQLKAERKLLGIQGAVVMVKDATGNKISYKDVGLTPAKGVLGGAVLGATLGILSGGVGLVLGVAGAAIGNVVGKIKQDSLYSSGQINQIATSLKPSTSAILAAVEAKHGPELEQELEALGADILTADISADIARQLEAHHDAAYSALVKELESD